MEPVSLAEIAVPLIVIVIALSVVWSDKKDEKGASKSIPEKNKPLK